MLAVFIFVCYFICISRWMDYEDRKRKFHKEVLQMWKDGVDDNIIQAKILEWRLKK